MRGFVKWLGRIIGSAVSLVLIIVLLPYASRLASTLMPDLSGNAITTSVTLSREMKSSARLETAVVDDEGVITSSTSALLLGKVQSVTIKYSYHASIGIDLKKVNIKVSGNKITFTLPQLEVLSDSLTPEEIVRDDFWYPLTDSRRQQLLDEEAEKCRAYYLSQNESSDKAWQDTIDAMESTVAKWVGMGNSKLTFEYVRAEEQN